MRFELTKCEGGNLVPYQTWLRSHILVVEIGLEPIASPLSAGCSSQDELFDRNFLIHLRRRIAVN